jgi:hypothetical protein
MAALFKIRRECHHNTMYFSFYEDFTGLSRSGENIFKLAATKNFGSLEYHCIVWLFLSTMP